MNGTCERIFFSITITHLNHHLRIKNEKERKKAMYFAHIHNVSRQELHQTLKGLLCSPAGSVVLEK